MLFALDILCKTSAREANDARGGGVGERGEARISSDRLRRIAALKFISARMH